MQFCAVIRVLLACFCLAGGVCSLWSEFEMVRAEGMNTTDSRPFRFEVKLKRHTAGVYKFFSNITVTAPLNEYMAEAQLFHSPKNNNKYMATPLRIPRGPLCSKINNEYRRFIMDETRNTSDLPVTDDPRADLCAMFEDKTYHVVNFEFRVTVLPRIMAAGMYKALIVISKNGVVTSGTDGRFRLS